MGRKTEIEWCGGGATWNPVQGCKHDCPYCYARGQVNRFLFKGEHDPDSTDTVVFHVDGTCELTEPVRDKNGKAQGYPFAFNAPTLFRYRLDVNKYVGKAPKTVFVGSMCDLFGEWVPDEWIKAVLDACATAPQHRYIFLTKNPKRYGELVSKHMLPSGDNFWFGMTIADSHSTDFGDDWYDWQEDHNVFYSCEPLLEDLRFDVTVKGAGCLPTQWVIIGAMTGRGSEKHQPRREWVENIVNACDAVGVPVFMKDSLIPIMGEENMRREFPWEV